MWHEDKGHKRLTGQQGLGKDCDASQPQSQARRGLCTASMRHRGGNRHIKSVYISSSGSRHANTSGTATCRDACAGCARGHRRALFRRRTRVPCYLLQIGFFDDKVGPITVAILVLLTMLTIFTIALLDFFY